MRQQFRERTKTASSLCTTVPVLVLWRLCNAFWRIAVWWSEHSLPFWPGSSRLFSIPKMKIALKIRRFQCVEYTKKNVTTEANEVPSEVFGDCFVQFLKSLKIVSQLRDTVLKENKLFFFFIFQFIQVSEIYCLNSHYSIVANSLWRFGMCFNWRTFLHVSCLIRIIFVFIYY